MHVERWSRLVADAVISQPLPDSPLTSPTERVRENSLDRREIPRTLVESLPHALHRGQVAPARGGTERAEGDRRSGRTS